MPDNTPNLQALAFRALDFVPDRAVVGLGTGKAATEFIRQLAVRVRGGLRVRGVATSLSSANRARQLGIPLVELSEVECVDVDVDGADEVDPRLDLIKGKGGAQVREKVVAAAARQVVILVGENKLVPVLGTLGQLPVEVLPFAASFCARQIARIGFDSRVRQGNGQTYVTDNRNHVLDCHVPPLADPAEVERRLLAIPGVVDCGLFLGIAHVVLVARDGRVEERRRPAPQAGGRKNT